MLRCKSAYPAHYRLYLFSNRICYFKPGICFLHHRLPFRSSFQLLKSLPCSVINHQCWRGFVLCAGVFFMRSIMLSQLHYATPNVYAFDAFINTFALSVEILTLKRRLCPCFYPFKKIEGVLSSFDLRPLQFSHVDHVARWLI